jgi:hypothetical protein
VVPRTRWILTLVLFAGCFAEPPKVDPVNEAVDMCSMCTSAKCKGHYDACNMDSTCVDCIAAPLSPTCLSHPKFRALAFCSCQECSSDCGYVCPGPEDGCSDCHVESPCGAQNMACAADMMCFPCIQDPYVEGCQGLTDYQTLATCQCDYCGARCVWQCDDAAANCAGCLLGPCADAMNACQADEACQSCFENSATPGCEANALLTELATCSCMNCAATELCGPLFDCG